MTHTRKPKLIIFRPILDDEIENENGSIVKRIGEISRKNPTSVSLAFTKHDNTRIVEPIDVATTVCQIGLNQVITMVKSILMFTSYRIHFHIFAENHLQQEVQVQLDNFFSTIRTDFYWTKGLRGGYVLSSFEGKFRYTVYDLWSPKENNQEWKSTGRLCSQQRFFLPSLLRTSDTVIYLDSDSISLNSIESLWRLFKEFNATQMIGLTQLEDSEDLNKKTKYRLSTPFPTFGELRVSNSVMLMNLTRMKQFNFVEKIINIRNKWKPDDSYEDQDVLNILFHNQQGLVYLLPCEWHYRPKHCNLGDNRCKTASLNGVNLIRGDQGTYHKNHVQAFRAISDIISQFDFKKDSMKNVSKVITERILKYEKGPCLRMSSFFVQHIRRMYLHRYLIIKASF